MESGEFRLILALFTSFFMIGAIGLVLNVPISEVLVLSVGSVFFDFNTYFFSVTIINYFCCYKWL